MKKILSIVAALFVMAGAVNAQELANFRTSGPRVASPVVTAETIKEGKTPVIYGKNETDLIAGEVKELPKKTTARKKTTRKAEDTVS